MLEKTCEILRGPKYVLIPFKESDVSDLYVSWLNDPEVIRYLEVRFSSQTRETALAFVRSFYGDIEKYIWGIYPKESGADPIGTTTLYDINRRHGWGELGLLIGDKAYWGRGTSEETIGLLESFAFETLGLRRLMGGTYAKNHGMNFTYRKLGFSMEGKLRSALMVSPGVYVDAYRWGILAEEWRARSQ